MHDSHSHLTSCVDKHKGRKFANDVKARFSGLFGWGSERGYLAANTAAGIKDIRRRKDAPDANRPWADEERDAVTWRLPGPYPASHRADDVHRPWDLRT